MATLFYLLAVFPTNRAVSEFRDCAVVSLPRLKVERTPGAGFPEFPDPLKRVAARRQVWVGSFETFVVFVDFLAKLAVSK